jgi:hypothetical protein
MCGIVGIFDPAGRREIDRALLERRPGLRRAARTPACLIFRAPARGAHRSGSGLAAELANLARRSVGERRPQLRHEGQEIREAIRPGPQNDYCEGALVEALLLRQVLVDRDERVESSGDRVEEGTVVEVAPSHLGCGLHLVTRQLLRQSARDASVENDAHRALRCGGFIEEGGLGELQDRDRMLARDAREIREEAVEGIARRDVLHDGLHRNPGSSEHRRPAQPIGRGGDEGIGDGHERSASRQLYHPRSAGATLRRIVSRVLTGLLDRCVLAPLREAPLGGTAHPAAGERARPRLARTPPYQGGE